MKFPFKLSLPKIRIAPKSCLGVDIGTSLIKIVSLTKSRGAAKLENYGETSAQALYEKSFRTIEKNTLSLSSRDIAKAIKAIIAEANIQKRSAVFSIPDFSSFFTTFDVPSMTKKELPQAVQFAAPQYIPLPLSEVSLDWQIIGGKMADRKGGTLKILLVAVPNDIINQYQDIARISGLELQGLEAEAFSLARVVSQKKDEKDILAMLDIGAQSTNCSIIEKGILKLSRSFDFAGNELTQILAKGLNIDYNKAEELKKKYGIIPSMSEQEDDLQKVNKILLPTIDSIIIESKRILQDFTRMENKRVDKIILSGGTVVLPGFLEHFKSVVKEEVEIIDPFLNILHSPLLEKLLKEIGPAYAIAVGAALRGLE